MRGAIVVGLWVAGCAPVETPDGAIDGELGAVQFEVTFDPAPPTAGPVVASVVLTDLATSDPIEGATVTVEPYMPSMGHGSGEVTVTDEGGGLYLAAWSFSMPGAWDVEVAVEEPEDHVTVAIDVE